MHTYSPYYIVRPKQGWRHKKSGKFVKIVKIIKII